jgi:hypothetical protein
MQKTNRYRGSPYDTFALQVDLVPCYEFHVLLLHTPTAKLTSVLIPRWVRWLAAPAGEVRPHLRLPRGDAGVGGEKSYVDG